MSPDTFGAAVGRGLENVGDTMHRVQMEQLQRANEIADVESMNRLAERRNALLNPQTGALSKRGKDALGSMPEDTLADYDKAVGEIEMGLGNPRQKQIFRQRAAQERISVNQTIQGHVAHEAEVVDRDETFAGVEHRANDAVASPFDAARLVGEQRELIRQYAARNGKPQAWTDQEADKHASNTHLQVLESLAASGDAQSAKAYHARFADEFKGKDSINALGIVNESVSREQSQKISDDILLKIEANDITTLSDAVAAAKAAAGDDAQLRDKSVERVKTDWATRQASIEQDDLRRFKQADEQFRDSYSLDDIDPGVWGKLSTAQRDEFKKRQMLALKREEPVTDWAKYRNYMLEAADPETQGKFLRRPLDQERSSFNEVEYKELVKLQADLLSHSPAAEAKLQGFRTKKQIVDGTIKALKFNAKKTEHFNRMVDERARGMEAVTGKPVTPDDIQKIVDGLLLVQDDGVFFDTQVYEADDAEDVPAEERAKIIEALIRRGKPTTPANIFQLYQLKQSHAGK